jgi:hypothetical protein
VLPLHQHHSQGTATPAVVYLSISLMTAMPLYSFLLRSVLELAGMFAVIFHDCFCLIFKS